MSMFKGNFSQVALAVISGTDNADGAWDQNIDLSAPAGSNGVVLWVLNKSSSQRWAGVRQPGKITPHYQEDILGGHARLWVVPTTNGLLDFYRESADIQFHIVSYPSAANWSFFDIDAALPKMPDTQSATVVVTAPAAVPLDAVALLMPRGRGAPTNAGAVRRLVNCSAVIPLDTENKCLLSSVGATTDIHGYCTGGVTWNFNSSVGALVADSTWRDINVNGSGTALLYASPSATTLHYSVRPKDSPFDNRSGNGVINTSSGMTFIAPSTGGIQYWIESGETAPDVRLDAWFDDAAAAPVAMLSGTLVTSLSNNTPYTGQVPFSICAAPEFGGESVLPPGVIVTPESNGSWSFSHENLEDDARYWVNLYWESSDDPSVNLTWSGYLTAH